MSFLENEFLTIHNHHVSFLYSLFEKETLFPCWMFTGQKGVGKTKNAYLLAKKILSKSRINPMGMSYEFVTHHMEKLSYPNFISLTPKEDSLSSEITIDQVRLMIDSLKKHPIIPGWRVVMINSADRLNLSAASSLLKILEEPPQKVMIILIVHHLGGVLATLRSRCQKIYFTSPTVQDWETLTKITVDQNLFKFCEGDLSLYSFLISEEGVNLRNEFKKIINNISLGNIDSAKVWCDAMAKENLTYTIVLKLIPRWIAGLILRSSGKRQRGLLESWSIVCKLLSEGEQVHLNKSHFLLALLLLIRSPKIDISLKN